MPPGMRLGDKAQSPLDAHGCPACPHPTLGPAIMGSPNVLVNNRPAVRQTDKGIHAACCGPNMWTATKGSATVMFNNLAAFRLGDLTTHCGGTGKAIEGSPNVAIGESTTSGGGAAPRPPPRAEPPAASPPPAAAAGGATASNANESGAGADEGSSAGNDGEETFEPHPILVAAVWSQARVPVATKVKLSAICADLAGTPATFSIRDADDETVVATVSATCGADEVEADWTTPREGPPGQFVFVVAARGLETTSDVLTLINKVEVKLVLDNEPAAGARMRLRVQPSGEELVAAADDKGIVVFEDAPFGDYVMLLDDGSA